MSVKVEVRADAGALAADVADALAARIRDAQQARGTAHIVLTGGGIGTAVMAELVTREIDWASVQVWWGDERFLAPRDPERNATQAYAVLLDHVRVPSANIHPMPADEGQGAEQAAIDYADELSMASTTGTVPRFDVLLLGVGPEGHVASIFPDSPAAHAGGAVVAVHECPKPPPTRVSLTFPSIRSAIEVWLVASGDEKAEAIARALTPGADPIGIPAAGARGQASTTAWLDEAAAARIGDG